MSSSGEDNLVGAEKDFEIKALKDEIRKLKNMVTKYQVLLKEVDENADPSMVSDEEAICIQEIAALKKLSDKGGLTLDDIKALDILHKNLKLARGESTRLKQGSRSKKATDEELEEIAKGK